MMDAPSAMAAPHVVPSGLEVDFDKNITPLYEAITSSNWEDAIKAANANPVEAKTWVVRHYDDEDSEGQTQDIMWRFLPIHSACARQPPAEVMTALLKAYPDGAKCVDDQGMYALHYACGNQASREVIRSLLMAFPDAAKLSDPRGMLPIHYLACWGPSSISVVDMVLVANRDVAESKDEDGNTPMQLAEEGEYPERAAVAAALKRWLDNGSKKSVSSEIEEKKEQDPILAERSAAGITPTNATMTNLTASAVSVGRLRHEVTQLKKVREEAENEWGNKMQKQQDMYTAQFRAMELKIRELEDESAGNARRMAELESDLQVKDAKLEIANNTIFKQKKELESANEERDGLRMTLSDLTEQHDKFKKRSEILGDRLGSLNASLYGMMEQQNFVVDAMRAREEQWNTLSDLRREKMKELIALEEQESTEELELKECLMKQTREMEAISAVIAAVRQSN